MRTIISIVLVGCLMIGCGDDGGSSEGSVTISNSTIQVACSNFSFRQRQIALREAEIVGDTSSSITDTADCDDDEVKVDCLMCLEDEFREELNQNVDQCRKTLEELGYCGEESVS